MKKPNINNPEAKNCWEFWNCNEKARSNCPAFELDSGTDCWMVAGSFTRENNSCPRLQKDIEFCWECEWYVKLNPDET